MCGLMVFQIKEEMREHLNMCIFNLASGNILILFDEGKNFLLKKLSNKFKEISIITNYNQ